MKEMGSLSPKGSDVVTVTTAGREMGSLITGSLLPQEMVSLCHHREVMGSGKRRGHCHHREEMRSLCYHRIVMAGVKKECMLTKVHLTLVGYS